MICLFATLRCRHAAADYRLRPLRAYALIFALFTAVLRLMILMLLLDDASPCHYAVTRLRLVFHAIVTHTLVYAALDAARKICLRRRQH